MPKPRTPKAKIRAFLSGISVDGNGVVIVDANPVPSMSQGMRHKVRTKLLGLHRWAKSMGRELTDDEIDHCLYGITLQERSVPRFNVDRLNDAIRVGLSRAEVIKLQTFLGLGDVPGYSWASEQHTNWLRSLPKDDMRLQPAGELCVIGSIPAELLKRDTPNNAAQAYDIFVACLPVSEFCYFALYPSGCQLSWLQCIVDSFTYFGGVPVRLDVTSPFADRRLYDGLLQHYGLDLTVRRETPVKRKPLGESVRARCIDWLKERGHQIVQSVGLPRAQATLIALNSIWNGTNLLNGSEEYSANAFCQLDAQELRSLPRKAYTPSKMVKVHRYDNHVEYRKNFYSAPYWLSGEEAELQLSGTELAVVHGGEVVARHSLFIGRGSFVTDPAHRASDRTLAARCDDLLNQFFNIGAGAVRWCKMTFDAEQGYVERSFRRCLSILGLGQKFSLQRLNTALKKAYQTRCHRYGGILDLLQPAGKMRTCRTVEAGLEFTIDRNLIAEPGMPNSGVVTIGHINAPHKTGLAPVIPRGAANWVVQVYKRVSHVLRSQRSPHADEGLLA